MFDNAVLHEPEMAIDAVHDGRHILPDLPTARESMPYTIVLPDQEIAVLIYTWVSKDSVAGGALAIFGPGVGGGPILQRLADRPIPRDMNFSDWRIDGLHIQQDLRFDRAHVAWETEQAGIDFQFEAFHPPYSYGADPRGCPSYLAADRIEQAGTVVGTLRIGERVIPFDATGHRDHSWGTRDWVPFQQHEWFLGQIGKDISVHFLRYQALGKQHIRGYVFKDGLMARVDQLQFDVRYDDAFMQTGYSAAIVDAAGRDTRIEATVFGAHGIIPDPIICLNESGSRATIDGKAGVGWLECGWPVEYLNHIRAHGPY